jgi:hypothetical protein
MERPAGARASLVLIIACAVLASCADPDRDGAQLPDAEPRDAGLPDAGPWRGAVCADSDPATLRCLDRCADEEVCFTQLMSTGSLPEPDATAGDDRCHPLCEATSDCEPGRRCVHELFFGCTGSDFNGWPRGRGVCE